MSSPSDSHREGGSDGADEAPEPMAPRAAVPTRPRPGLWSRISGVAFLRAHRRELLRGAMAGVVAGGILFSLGGSLPGAGSSEAAQGADGSADAPVAVVSGENVTIDQALAVLDRAHRLAAEQGASLDPQIAQAAAELGMLYATYQAQQDALRFATGVLDPRTGAMVGVPQDVEVAVPGTDRPDVDDEPQDRIDMPATPASNVREVSGRPTDDLGQDERVAADRPERDAQTGTETGAQSGDAATAGDAERGTGARGAQAHGTERDTEPHGTAVGDDGTGTDLPAAETPTDMRDHDSLVTRHDVVLAAQRLALLMDPTMADTLVVAPVPAGGAGDPLRQDLESVVEAFRLSTAGFANGRIPTNVLCPLEFAPGHLLRCDAAERLTALSEKYEQRFGTPIPITDSYRAYEQQVSLRALKPDLAAIPGTSKHGWGIAVDLGNPISTGRSAEYAWLRVQGPDYGWDNPVWARLDGSKPEPWHFEFFAAGAIPNRMTDVSDVVIGEDPKPGAGPATTPARNKSSASKDKDKDTADRAGGSGKGDDSSPKPSKPSKPGGGSDKDEPSPSPSPTKPSPSPSPTKPSPSPSPTKPSPSPSDPSPSPSDPSPSPSAPSPSPSPGDEDSCTDDSGTDGPGTDDDATDDSATDDSATDDSDTDDSGTDDSGTDGSGTGESGTDDSGTDDADDPDTDEPCADDEGEPDASTSSGSSEKLPSGTDALAGLIGVVLTRQIVRRRRPGHAGLDGEDPLA
ncbi:M15 family metallopeptidase [Myceligenerans cantabricum]